MNAPVKVSKASLLKALEDNLAEHQKIVQEAKAGYRDKAKGLLQERLDKVVSGQPFDLSFNLGAPQDHSTEYKNAIEMLRWSLDQEVTLEPSDFKALVLNQWSWQRQFLAGNSLYSATASGCLAAL